MSESVKSHIFEPFFTTKPTGSGLGLAICRSIVDAHRGSIRVENHRGQIGTTIVVELPVADAGIEALQSVAVVKDTSTINPPTGTSGRTTD
jgi:two-component system sensor histidine kinase AtoS